MVGGCGPAYDGVVELLQLGEVLVEAGKVCHCCDSRGSECCLGTKLQEFGAGCFRNEGIIGLVRGST
jgi:hypothetical protein